MKLATNIGITASVLAIVYHLMVLDKNKVFKNPIEEGFEDLDELRFQRTMELLDNYTKGNLEENLDLIAITQESFMKATVDIIEREELAIKQISAIADKYKAIFMKSRGDDDSRRTYDKYLKYNSEMKSKASRILKLKKHLAAMVDKQKEITKLLTRRH